MFIGDENIQMLNRDMAKQRKLADYLRLAWAARWYS